MRFPAEVLITLALGFAIYTFWRLHQRNAPVPISAGAPPGAGVVPLGQFAVAADRRWLLITPGS